MVLRVILFVVAYIFVGVVSLEVMLWHDKQVECLNEWVGGDEGTQAFVVAIAPFSFLWVVFWLLFLLMRKLVKGLRIVITAIIYTAVALIKGKENKDE